jgi:hypothetical protein
MKQFTPFIALALAVLLGAASSCSSETKPAGDKADSTNIQVATALRFAYALPASQANFLFSNPSQCTLQVVQNGQPVKNFVDSDLPLKVTVNAGGDSLVFQTQTDPNWKSGINFGLDAQSNFSSFVIKAISQNQGKTGGIGTIDLRDMLRQYVTDVQTCGMGLNWTVDSLYVTTDKLDCICYRDSSLGTQPSSVVTETQYSQCGW